MLFIRVHIEQSAEAFCARLVFLIQEYEKKLDRKHEVGARLVSFGETVIFHVEQIGYLNPSLIIFRGVNSNGEPVELVQHIGQISVLLVKVKALDMKNPRRIMGFAPPEKDK